MRPDTQQPINSLDGLFIILLVHIFLKERSFLMSRRVGLVLSGGGGKGSYQIGALKALKEYGWDKSICAIAGTSVGALNTGLFLQNNLHLAEEVWLTISPSKILSLDADHLLHQLILSGIIKTAPPSFLYWAKRLAQHGFFSRDGMLDILNNQIDLSLIAKATIPSYATCFDIFSFGVEYFSLNDQPLETITSILLASSAIPIIFGAVEIHERKYVDGGLADNVPITPLYRVGCDVIIILYLDRSQEIPRDLYPDVTLLPIVPLQDQGGILSGTLDFHPEAVKRRIAQGYADTIQLLSPYESLLRAEKRRSLIVEPLSQEKREESPTQLKKRREELKALIQQFQSFVIDEDSLEPTESFPINITDNSSLPNELSSSLLEKEREALDTKVEKYLQINESQSQLLLDVAFHAISYLAPLQGRAQALKEQGPFQRFFQSITGKNLTLSAANQKDLALSQYAALSLIHQVYERGLMTLEAVIALNNKTNRLFAEILHTKEDLSQLSITIYHRLTQLLLKMRQELGKEQQRLDALSSHLDLYTWLTKLHQRTYKSRPYPTLKEEELFVCLVHDFFTIAQGNWRAQDLLSLKEAFSKLSLLETKVDPSLFVASILKDRALSERLLRGLSMDDLLLKGSPLTDLLEEPKISKEEREKTMIPLQVPLYDLALEILYGLSHYGYIEEELQDRAKAPLIETLSKMREITQRYSLFDETKKIDEILLQLESQSSLILFMDHDSSHIPLLLSFLQLEHLTKEELLRAPIPTEFHLAEDNSIERRVLYFQDERTREHPLSFGSSIPIPAHQLHHQKIYLKRRLLAEHPMVLAQLPSLSSSNKNQKSSLQGYLEEGHLFFISTKNDQTLIDLFNHLGDSFFQEKAFGLFIEEKRELFSQKESPLSAIYGQALFVASLSTPEDIQKGLDLLKSHREESIHRIYGPQIKKRGLYLQQSLTLLAQGRDFSLASFKEREARIREEKRELKEIAHQERERLQEEIGPILHTILQDMKKVLEEHRGEFLSMLQSNTSIEDRAEELIKTTFNQGMRERALPLFLSAASRVSKDLSLKTHENFSLEKDLSLAEEELKEIEEKLEQATMSTTSLLLFGPVGFLLRGLFHLLTSRRRKEKLEEELDAWIANVLNTIASEGEEHLLNLSIHFFLFIEERAEEELERIRALLHTLKEEIRETKEKRERWEKQIQEDLIVAQKILFER